MSGVSNVLARRVDLDFLQFSKQNECVHKKMFQHLKKHIAVSDHEMNWLFDDNTGIDTLLRSPVQTQRFTL